MNEYLYIDYDEDSIVNYEQVKLSLTNCFKEYNQLNNVDLVHKFDTLWDNIQMYRTRLTIIYDGVNIFGFIGYSKLRFLNHRVIQFVYLVEPKKEKESIGELLDGFSNHISNPYLSVITKENEYNILEQNGFFNINLSNKEGLTFLMRKQNMIPPSSARDINDYYTAHKKYKKIYILIYSSLFYFFVLVFLGFGFALLARFTNLNFNLFRNPYSTMISIVVMVIYTFLSVAIKVHKRNGIEKFGFKYNMVLINTTEFKFHDKFREFVLTGIKVIFLS